MFGCVCGKSYKFKHKLCHHKRFLCDLLKREQEVVNINIPSSCTVPSSDDGDVLPPFSEDSDIHPPRPSDDKVIYCYVCKRSMKSKKALNHRRHCKVTISHNSYEHINKTSNA